MKRKNHPTDKNVSQFFSGDSSFIAFNIREKFYFLASILHRSYFYEWTKWEFFGRKQPKVLLVLIKRVEKSESYSFLVSPENSTFFLKYGVNWVECDDEGSGGFVGETSKFEEYFKGRKFIVKAWMVL